MEQGFFSVCRERLKDGSADLELEDSVGIYGGIAEDTLKCYQRKICRITAKSGLTLQRFGMGPGSYSMNN